jgi:hypothetical protein
LAMTANIVCKSQDGTPAVYLKTDQLNCDRLPA